MIALPAVLPFTVQNLDPSYRAVREAVDALSRFLRITTTPRFKETSPCLRISRDTSSRSTESTAAESYRLVVDRTGIQITSAGLPGITYGVQTLLQILAVVNGQERILPELTIEDGPDFAVRAGHLTLFRYQNQRPSLPFWEALITKVTSSARLNALIIQTDWMLRYRSHPEMSQPDALTVEQIRRLVALGREHHIAVIPHLQCLSHQYSLIGYGHPEWLVAGGGETYNPTAAGLRPLLRGLMADLYAAYRVSAPLSSRFDFLHVGMDEVGRLPNKAGESATDTFFQHLAELTVDVKALGFGATALWPDMLPRYSPRDSGKSLVSRLPTGTIVFPWDYADRKDFAVMKPFVGTGVRVWATGSAKYQRDNLGRLARAAHQSGCEGLVGSCWNSWGPLTLDTVARPLSGLLLAGEFGWRADSDRSTDAPLRVLPYDPMVKVRELLAGYQPVVSER